jgi:hypothetical protein
MNIKIDIDVTPDEMRKLMGLPDVEAFQQQLLDDVRERMQRGVDGYDPMALLEPYIKGSLAGMDWMQRLFGAGLSQRSGGSGDDKD